MGVRKTTDFLEKATWGLAVFMLVVSILSAYALPSATETQGIVISDQVEEKAQTGPYNFQGVETPEQTEEVATEENSETGSTTAE